jgi:uncharacterized protein YkwD
MPHGRLFSAIRATAVVLTTALMMSLPFAHAQNVSTLPQVITKRLESGRIIVTVAPIGDDVNRVVIQRKLGRAGFVTVASLQPTRGRVRFTDTTRSKKRRLYRAQLRRVKGNPSLWSVISEAPTGQSSGGVSSLAVSGCPAGFLDALHFLANQARAREGVAPLSFSSELTVSAQEHANFMSWSQILTHEGWMEGIARTGYVGQILGQNVASGSPTPETVITEWLNSPGHRRNLLSSTFTEDGFGCMRDDNGGFWWVHNLGRS